MEYSEERINKISEEIVIELASALRKHRYLNSLHEAVAVIREEYLELESAVFFGKTNNLTIDDVKKEAIQLSAMAMELVFLIEGKAENFTQLK
jgi:hypothetical protein